MRRLSSSADAATTYHAVNVVPARASSEKSLEDLYPGISSRRHIGSPQMRAQSLFERAWSCTEEVGETDFPEM